jgi:uncharacterized protein
MPIPQIDVRDLLGHAGAQRTQEVQGTLEGLGTEVASVAQDQPVTGSLLLESVVEGILITGRLTGILQLECVRCLTDFTEPFDLAAQEMFVPNAGPEDDEYPLDPSGLIDPEQMFRDTIGLELPFAPLCKPECLGLCPVCGGDRNLNECPGGHESMDPRWQGLDEGLQQLLQIEGN